MGAYIDIVNRLVNILISSVLLLCISVTIVPLNLLHQHKAETHCDKTNRKLENSPCHISTYHSSDLTKIHCQHKNHLEKKHSHCKFCKFLNTNRSKYLKTHSYINTPIQFSKAIIVFEHTVFSKTFSSVIFSRGPPA